MEKKLFLLFITITFIFQNLMTYGQQSIVISLGRDCGPAGFLRRFHLRDKAYPFDWWVTDDFKKVCELIEEKFALIWNANFLEWHGRMVKNIYYNIEFIHDFPTKENNYIVPHDVGETGDIPQNFLNYVDGVRKKYIPRIQRFFDALNGKNPVIFLRTHINPEESKYFINLMKANYPNLTYTLVIIHFLQDEKYEWNLPNVLNFYVDSSQEAKFAQDYYTIFQKLGLTA